MRIVAITACHTGIAHCYMAAESLLNAGKSLSIQIKVETQGAMGIDNKLSIEEFERANCILLAAEITLLESERYINKNIEVISLQDAINKPKTVLMKIKKQHENKVRLYA